MTGKRGKRAGTHNTPGIVGFAEATKIAKEHNVTVEKHFTVGHIINAFFEKYCEEKCQQPIFITEHPIDISPLAKKGHSIYNIITIQ